MTDVDAVLFDLDETLCTYRRPVEDVLAAAFDDVGVDPLFEAGDYFARFDEFHEGSDGIDELRRRCFAALAREAGHDPATGRAVADAFAAERDHRDVEVLPGAERAVRSLATAHRLGVVTNGDPDMQSEKLAGTGFADAFETVVFAGYDAPAKPDPAPFERALADLDAAADRAVHVGNSSESDVAGAHAAGCRSAWVGTTEDDPAHEPTYRLGGLADLTHPPWR